MSREGQITCSISSIALVSFHTYRKGCKKMEAPWQGGEVLYAASGNLPMIIFHGQRLLFRHLFLTR